MKQKRGPLERAFLKKLTGVRKQQRLDHELILMELTRAPVYLVDINRMCRRHDFGTRERLKLMRAAKKLGLWKQPEGAKNYGN